MTGEDANDSVGQGAAPPRLTVKKITWALVGRVTEPGRYIFAFGWLTITTVQVPIRGREVRFDGFNWSQTNLSTEGVDHAEQVVVGQLAQILASDRAGVLQLHRSFPPFRTGL